MEKEQIMVGIDIGTTKVCAIVAQMNEHNKLEILGTGEAKSEGITKGKVIQKNMTVNAIKNAVAQAERASDIKIDTVNVGIAGGHISSIITEGTTTRENDSVNGTFTEDDVDRLADDVRRRLEEPGKVILHIMPQSYSIDGNSTLNVDPVGCYGLELKGTFHTIMANKLQINILSDCIEAANLTLNEFILEPLASALSVLTPEEQEQGVCLLDIGGGTTDLVVYKNGVIQHTCCIEAGGVIITEDIKTAFGITKEKAELIKIKYGSALPVSITNERIAVDVLANRQPKEIELSALAGVIGSRMEEILNIVYDELSINKYIDKLPAGIVITGGGSALTDIKPLTSHITGLEVKKGIPDLHLSGDTKELRNPKYSTSIGLVKSCFDYQNHNIDNGNNKSKTSNNAFMNFFAKITRILKPLINEAIFEKDRNY